MKPYYYEGILEKECYKQLAVMNGNEMLGCSMIVQAKYREHSMYKSVLLYDLLIIDKTKSRNNEKDITIRISPKGFRPTLSHHYRAGDQAFGYKPRRECYKCSSIEEALSKVANILFFYYKLNDDDGDWVPSTSHKE